MRGVSVQGVEYAYSVISLNRLNVVFSYRWDVDTNDFLRLKLLAHHKQLANYKNMKSLQ